VHKKGREVAGRCSGRSCVGAGVSHRAGVNCLQIMDAHGGGGGAPRNLVLSFSCPLVKREKNGHGVSRSGDGLVAEHGGET